MLQRFFSRLLSVLSSVVSVQKVKKDSIGICYVTGLRRYISILLDLIIIVLFLQFYSQLLNYFFVNSENSKILSQVASKYSMQIPLSLQEEIVKSRYVKLIILNQLSQFIMLFYYIVYMWVKFAATPGKLLLGLMVVDSNTFKNITFKQATKRFFSFMLSIPPLFLGFIWAHFSKRCQTWHDKIASTVVVTNKSLRQSAQKSQQNCVLKE